MVEKWCWCRTFPGDGELRLPVVYRNSIIEGEIMNKKIRKKLRRLSQFFLWCWGFVWICSHVFVGGWEKYWGVFFNWNGCLRLFGYSSE